MLQKKVEDRVAQLLAEKEVEILENIRKALSKEKSFTEKLNFSTVSIVNEFKPELESDKALSLKLVDLLSEKVNKLRQEHISQTKIISTICNTCFDDVKKRGNELRRRNDTTN